MDDSNVASKLLQARSLADRGEEIAAIEAYEEVVSIDPENSTAWYCLGVLYSGRGLTHRAVEALENADRQFPNHGPTLSNLAILLENEDPPRASEYARIALLSNPDHKALGRIASLSEGDEPPRLFLEATPLQEYPKERPDIGIAPELDDQPPVGSEGMMIEAESHTSSGDHAAAVAVWKGLLEGSPDSAEVWRGLGEALEAAGYPDRAKQCRQRANSIDEAQYQVVDPIQPDEETVEEALVQAALTHSSEELDLTERGGDLNASIEWYNKGLSFLQEEKGEEALTCFEKAIGGCPKDEVELRVRAQNGRGHALFKSSRFTESVLAYHTAISMDPTSVTGRALFNMGSSYAAVELYDDAIKCFTQSLERGLEKDDANLCEKQISRCRLLSREQLKRQSKASR
ncbi:MAG: tetratricopeptide repeat protein [Candidatus Thermoplasmatota archaeon]|nr:tetratricopeptide repeat protein [Candidatus Thermoplasmatota archaeon]